MLKIFVGDSKTTIRPVSQYFGAIYKPEWLDDLGCSVESLGQYCTEEMEKRIHYDKSKLPNCLHVDRDCLSCQ